MSFAEDLLAAVLGDGNVGGPAGYSVPVGDAGIGGVSGEVWVGDGSYPSPGARPGQNGGLGAQAAFYDGDVQQASWSPATWPAAFWQGFRENVVAPIAAEAPIIGVYTLLALLFLIGVTMLFFNSGVGKAVVGGASGEVTAIGRERGRRLVRRPKEKPES